MLKTTQNKSGDRKQNNETQNQKTSNKIVDLNPNISAITTNLNSICMES